MAIQFLNSGYFAGSVALGSGNISMSSASAGQLQIAGAGYTGAIALDATAMYIYHNSSSRDLVLGTNETARITIDGSSGSASFTDNIVMANAKILYTDDIRASTGPMAVGPTGNSPLTLRSNGTTRLTIGSAGLATFSSTPIVLTRSAGDNTTYAASTAFVTTAVAAVPIGDYLPLAGGTMTGTNGVVFPDNFKLKFGDATTSDLEIYHNGTNSYIDNNFGHLYIRNNVTTDNGKNIYLQAKSGENGIIINDDSSVQLYNNNILKLQTSSTGVTVTGTAKASAIEIESTVPSVLFDETDVTANWRNRVQSGSYRIQYASDGTTFSDYFVLGASANTVEKDTTFAGNISAGSGTFSAFVYAEDEIHLTDAGTTRAKLLLNSSDRDNVELRAESLGSTMKFFTVGTEALELDASQNATFTGDVTAPSFIGKLMGGATGAPDATIWCVSGDYTNWGIFYDENSPDVIQFKSAGTTTASISLDNGDYIGRNATFSGSASIADDINITNAGGVIQYIGSGFIGAQDNFYVGGATTGTDHTYIGDTGRNVSIYNSAVFTVESGDVRLLGTGRIQGVDTVTDGTDAANKTYVDTTASGAGNWANIGAGTRSNYNLYFQPTSANYAGFSFTTSAGNGGGYFLIRGDSSGSGVYAPGGITLVGDGGDLTIATRTLSTSNLRFGTGTAGATRMQITGTGAFSFGTTATNYGTSGQVMTSNGNATPGWTTKVSTVSDDGGSTINVSGSATARTVAAVTSAVSSSSANLATGAQIQTAINTAIDTIPSGLAFEGNWNANTDSPDLSGASPDNGQFWIVSVAGSTNLSGITDWKVGDWAIYVATGAGTDGWQKVDNTSTLSGAGTVNALPLWTGTTSLGTSRFTQSSTQNIITGPGNAGSDNSLRVNNAAGTNQLYIQGTGEVVVSQNYFYVAASQGMYSNGLARFRGGITNDQGNLNLGGSNSTGNLTLTSGGASGSARFYGSTETTGAVVASDTLTVSGNTTLSGTTNTISGNTLFGGYTRLGGRLVNQYIANLSASGQQARQYEIARAFMDYNDWNNTGVIKINLMEQYFDEGIGKEYAIRWGYNNTVDIDLINIYGGGDNANGFECVLGTLTQIGTSDIYYLPIIVKIRYYANVGALVTTNRNLTTNATSTSGGVIYINPSPTAVNISDFSIVDSVEFSGPADNINLGTASTKVGIGFADATLPTQALDVNANMRLRGRLYDVNNNQGGSGDVLVSTGSGVDWVSASTPGTGTFLPLAGGTMTTTAKIEFYNASQYIHANSTNDLTIASGDDINFQTNYARFFNASVEHARLSSTTNSWIGNGTNSQVGINKANPTYNLDVEGTFRTTGAATIEGNVTATDILTVAGAATGNPYLQFTQGGSQKAYIQYVDSGDSFEFQTDNQFAVRTGGSTVALTINSSQNATFAGNVTVGQPTHGYGTLNTSGQIYIEHQGTAWNETTPGTTRGAIHMDPVGSGANDTGNAITFGASDHSGGTVGDAGIYVRSDGNYGTKMYIATTDSYSVGSKTAITILQNGSVTINRSHLTISTITNSSSDTDKFLVSNGGQVQYRTGAQVLSDIGGAPATGGSYLPLAGGAMANTNLVTNMNADLLDGISSASFLRSDAVDGASQRISFNANATNNWDTIATAAGSQGGIEIYNSGSGNDAFMAFHAGNDFAFYFGIDADNNQLSVGGWSMGANKYKVWNESNDGAGSGLDADLLDGQQGSYYATAASLNNYLPKANPAFTGTLTGPAATISNKIIINSTNAPNNLAILNIGYSGGGETRSIDLDGGWGGGESKSITATHGSASTNIVGQMNFQHNGPGSSIRFGKLYHSGDSSTYTMQLVSTSSTTADLTVAGNMTTAGDITVSGGDITLGGTGRIQGIDTVSATTDAANKAYVDSLSADDITALAFTGTTTQTLTATQRDTSTLTASFDITKIKAGGNGPSAENLNTVANSVSVGELEYRGFNSNSSNIPPVSDNANGVITVGQHSGNYNAQLAFSSDGNMYWRDNPSTGFGSWNKILDANNTPNGPFLPLSGGTMTGTISMGTQIFATAGNYGRGVFGVYSPSRYQHVWSMGTAYKLADAGTSTGVGGNLYGLAWSYNPDHDGVGNNAQAKAGLNHQLLLMQNGTTTFAAGSGMWTSGTITADNGQIVLNGTGRIQGVDTVSASTDAANKAYVDAHPGTGGTVTSVATGGGLDGGTITTTGTIEVEYDGVPTNIIQSGFDFTGDTVVPGDYMMISDPGQTTTNRRIGYVTVGDLPKAPQTTFTRDINASTWTMLCTVNGDRLASIVDLTITGTSNGVVMAASFEIIVNHYQDIHVRSMSGDYVNTSIRITSNNNEDFSIEAKAGGGSTTSVEVCVFPRANEAITPTTTDPGYTGEEYIHTAVEGWRFGGEDGNTTSARVSINGALAIGTTFPGKPLTVNGTIRAEDNNSGDYIDITNDGSVSGHSKIETSNGNLIIDPSGILDVQANAVVQTSNGVGDFYIGNYATAKHFRFHTNNSQTYFDMNCGQINWREGSSTRYYFYPSTANMTINGTLTQNSDSRVKENVVEIDNCISKVQAMRGVYYNRTDFNTEVTKVGVIAQEVEAVLPELILEASDTGLKSVAYAELTAVLINAIKEQQEIIDDLKTRIIKLEK